MSQNTNHDTNTNNDRYPTRRNTIRRVPTVRRPANRRAPAASALSAAMPRPKSLGGRRVAVRGLDFPASFAALPFWEVTAVWRNGRLVGLEYPAPDAALATAAPTSVASA